MTYPLIYGQQGFLYILPNIFAIFQSGVCTEETLQNFEKSSKNGNNLAKNEEKPYPEIYRWVICKALKYGSVSEAGEFGLKKSH